MFHVKHDPLVGNILRDAEAMALPLSEENADRLLRFTLLLRRRALPLGLVSAADGPRLYERHVRDSLRAAALFRAEDTTAFDLGSGAGLPGVVLAVAVPWCRFVLVEPRRLRIGFLELAVETLDLSNVEVSWARGEELSGLADVVTARAFAPLRRSWRVASALLRPSGRLIYFAGESLKDPIGEARTAVQEGPPADVTAQRVLATSPPLVIMARK
jgi:16S rRNA (guanine527-N7)-methyltransferase